MQAIEERSAPCGNVGLRVHVRAHRPDRERVRGAGRSGLKRAGPGGSWSGPVGYGRVRVRSALGRLGRQESCGARLGRAGSEVHQQVAQ